MTKRSFLDTMAQEVPAEEKQIDLVLENASWQKIQDSQLASDPPP